ncbi:MAG: type VI secretion system tube protein Hcp [Alphaproteobacteria bacterium]|nr:type VI secretion system tube protein Hcp [Alphaproteobacteria bacterium]MCW5742446.1 type VI secretion system tube protein Hcp [Alphaproteobacteria bacterium]
MPIYMNYDGVDGDVTAEGHAGWINLHSVQWGSSRGVTTSGEVGHRAKSAVQMREVVVTKDRDHASGKLWREHLVGDPKTVEIVWTTTSQGGELIYQKMKLTNVLVSSFASSGHADDKPVEQISFNFTEIEGTFYDMAQQGTKTSKPFVQSYNLSKG